MTKPNVRFGDKIEHDGHQWIIDNIDDSDNDPEYSGGTTIDVHLYGGAWIRFYPIDWAEQYKR